MMMMAGNHRPAIAVVPLVSVLGHAVHTGPGLSFPIAAMREAGQRAIYDAMPIIGEPIDGAYEWYRMVLPPEGFVHGSYLQRIFP